MSEKVRIYNKNKFDVGIVTMNGIGVNIKNGSFTVLEQDDIDYISTLCNYFIDGTLQIEENTKARENLIIPEENKRYFESDEDIKKKLKGTAKTIEKWLENENNTVYLDRIESIAKTMDLAKSKIDAIESALKQARGEKEYEA